MPNTNAEASVLIVAPQQWGEMARNILSDAGYDVALCVSGAEAIRRKEWQAPSIVLTTWRLSDMPGLDVAQAYRDTCMSIMVCKRDMEGLFKDLEEHIVTVYLPISSSMLLQTVDLVVQMSSKMFSLKSKLDDMQRSMEEHRQIDRVKALIMEQYGMSEKEAHRALQKLSMDSGRRMADIARSLLEEKFPIKGTKKP